MRGSWILDIFDRQEGGSTYMQIDLYARTYGKSL